MYSRGCFLFEILFITRSQNAKITVDAIQISHKIQPIVVLLKVPDPTNTVRNARDGKQESDKMRSQSAFDILPLLYKETAELTEVVYPPTRPKKKGDVAFLSIPNIFPTIDLNGLHRKSIAPHSVAISDTVINGKREGIKNVEHCLSELITDALAIVGLLSKIENKKTDANIENISEKESFNRLSFFAFFSRFRV